VVNMTNGTYVYVGFGTFKRFLSHKTPRSNIFN